MTPPVPVSPHPEEGLRNTLYNVLVQTPGCGQCDDGEQTAYWGARDCRACADLLLQAVGRVIEEATIERAVKVALDRAERWRMHDTPTTDQWRDEAKRVAVQLLALPRVYAEPTPKENDQSNDSTKAAQ